MNREDYMREGAFVTITTIYQAEVSWWWIDEKLHDVDYTIKVNDSMNAKVNEIIDKYDVYEDASYCCQWEGKMLVGDNLSNVEAAGNELAAHLKRFKGVIPL